MLGWFLHRVFYNTPYGNGRISTNLSENKQNPSAVNRRLHLDFDDCFTYFEEELVLQSLENGDAYKREESSKF